MKTRKLLLVITLLAIVGTAVFLFWTRGPAPAARLEAEREVYSAMLSYLIAPDDLSQIGDYTLIDEYTTVGESQKEECTVKGTCYPFGSDELAGLKRSTLEDFQMNNRQTYPIRDYLPVEIDRSFLTVDSQKVYWWRLSFSRIGLDPALTQAVVLVGDCRGDGCFGRGDGSMRSTGTAFFLVKVDREWGVQGESFAWITENPSP